MKNRGTAFDWEAFQARDARRKELLSEIEALRQKRNRVSEQVAEMKRAGENAASIIANMREVSTTIKDLGNIPDGKRIGNR